jgi:hypothetical protein
VNTERWNLWTQKKKFVNTKRKICKHRKINLWTEKDKFVNTVREIYEHKINWRKTSLNYFIFILLINLSVAILEKKNCLLVYCFSTHSLIIEKFSRQFIFYFFKTAKRYFVLLSKKHVENCLLNYSIIKLWVEKQ